jgi:hypothetical protein
VQKSISNIKLENKSLTTNQANWKLKNEIKK